jgi:alpha-galactosidase
MYRRNFVKLSATALAAVLFSRLSYASSPGNSLINHPDEAWAQINDQWFKLRSTSPSTFQYQNVTVEIVTKSNAQAIYLQAPDTLLQAIRISWKYDSSRYSKSLGDHYERSYGDLAWKQPDASDKKPWYVLLNDDHQTASFGVKTGSNTLCYWNVDRQRLQLTMDTRSGGMGVKLGSRKLHAADVVTALSKTGESPFAMATRFCKIMCEKPLLPKQPVYGINDWYAVYGKNSYQSIQSQTEQMATLVSDTKNRPFSVIDDGWQQPDDFSIANEKFKDMHKMADEIKRLGMRPGLWTRPLIARLDDSTSRLAPQIPGRNDASVPILDPTIPENLERIAKNLKLYHQWGYEMVKHDFSSFDIFGRWGFQMKNEFTTPGWKFYDQSRTNAEIMLDLYKTIRKSSGDMYIIGCNTMSHLSAGLFELNRTGDDTSGKEWARTRKMGVNTLAFRLPHHDTFYAADGDCVGLTKDVPWSKNKQWLQLLAESGAPLFISAETDFMGSEQKAAVKTAFAQAAKQQPVGEPIDWLNNPLPNKWKLNNRLVTFDWSD